MKKNPDTAAIKLLPKFLESMKWGHGTRSEEIVSAMAESLDLTHPSVAEKIRKLYAQGLKPLPSSSKAAGLIDFAEPRHGMKDVVLPDNVAQECRAIIAEHARRDELAAFALQPRHKVLLHGAPGNGKTMLAEALASELAVPYLRVKYSSLIDSYLGSTAKNLDVLLDYANTAPCLLFLDEFDGVGMDRNDNRDVGEMRRITNQLLISLDRLPSSCVFVGATNAPGLIDGALRRRFDFVIEIPAPSWDVKYCCAAKELDPDFTPGHDVWDLAPRVAHHRTSLSMHDVVEICRRIRRDLVLNGGAGIETILAP